ncbi:hypothetical protein SADUNF_Sadunf19G0051400 [Salix dunnii]|uniref:Uncharacterized protein n=1 Tax=Salix dunnii TaxID=1413687 RepID=A0A835IYH4_9ROSI|nr:hypothetical protein SADUNF_Sadunf19G0051400 [Salix dunnii]
MKYRPFRSLSRLRGSSANQFLKDLSKCAQLNLPNSFSADTHQLPDLLQCFHPSILHTKSPSDDLILPWTETFQNSFQIFCCFCFRICSDFLGNKMHKIFIKPSKLKDATMTAIYRRQQMSWSQHAYSYHVMFRSHFLKANGLNVVRQTESWSRTYSWSITGGTIPNPSKWSYKGVAGVHIGYLALDTCIPPDNSTSSVALRSLEEVLAPLKKRNGSDWSTSCMGTRFFLQAESDFMNTKFAAAFSAALARLAFLSVWRFDRTTIFSESCFCKSASSSCVGSKQSDSSVGPVSSEKESPIISARSFSVSRNHVEEKESTVDGTGNLVSVFTEQSLTDYIRNRVQKLHIQKDCPMKLIKTKNPLISGRNLFDCGLIGNRTKKASRERLNRNEILKKEISTSLDQAPQLMLMVMQRTKRIVPGNKMARHSLLLIPQGNHDSI